MDQRKALVELLCAVECKGYDRREGGCNFRQDDRCNRINKLEMCMIEQIADHLLSNGVIVPPCKAGDTIYMPWEYDGEKGVACLQVIYIMIDTNDFCAMTDLTSDCEEFLDKYRGVFYTSDFGKTVFLTSEKAEKALAERSKS